MLADLGQRRGPLIPPWRANTLYGRELPHAANEKPSADVICVCARAEVGAKQAETHKATWQINNCSRLLTD